MKFSFEFSFGQNKKPAAVETAGVDAAPEQKSGGSWDKLWPLGLEYTMLGVDRVSKPFTQNANVYKAISAIAENIPQAEIAFYKSGTNEEIEDKNLERLFYRPNKLESWNDFLERLAGYFAAQGEFFIILEKSVGQVAGTSKLPAELWTDHPCEFEEVIDERTQRPVAWTYKGNRYDLTEVIHSKKFNLYDPWRGASPLTVIDGEVQLDWKALQYNQRFMDNDATPGFTLTTDKNLTEEQRKRLIEWSEKRNKGLQNKGKVAIFDGGLKPAQTGSTHKDMEYIDQREYAREEVLGTFKTPKALFNITEALNYATFTGQMKIFWLYALVPILRKIEEGINYGLVDAYSGGKFYFAFKLDNIPAFQEDFKDKVTTAKTLFDMGFTANEINQKLNLGFEEKDWRDVWWIGFGQVPADPAAAAANMAGGEDPDTETGETDEEKRVRKTSASYKKWQSFIQKQAPIEGRFRSKIKTYFYGLRAEVMGNLAKQGLNTSIEKLADWGKADDELKKVTVPLIRQGAYEGIEVGKDLINPKKSLQDDQLKAAVESLVAERGQKIVGVNRTVKRGIANAIAAGLENGDSIEMLADRVRGVFNASTSRSVTIARTETSGAVNGGSAIYYEQSGVKKKEWITAGDELVRETHRKIDGEQVDPTKRFSNGLAFPGDPGGEAEDVINCRCTIAPVD